MGEQVVAYVQVVCLCVCVCVCVCIYEYPVLSCPVLLFSKSVWVGVGI